MVTPFRKTHFRTDIGVPHVAEPAFSFGRRGGEIARGGKERTGSIDTRLLATGAWCIAPFADRPNFAVRTDNGGGPLRAADFNLAADMVERPFFRSSTDLDGVTVGANVAAQGNYFLVREVDVSASTAWKKTLTADEAALPAPALPEGNDVSQSRKAVSTATYSIYQGWQFTLIVPASYSANSQQVLAGFSFAAPPSDTAGTTGLYYLRYLYGGEAILSEQVATSSTDDDGHTTVTNNWVTVHQWRFAPVTRNYGLRTICRVVPHIKPASTQGQGRNTSFSAFLMFQMDVNEQNVPTVADPFSKLSRTAGGDNNFSDIYAYQLKHGLDLKTDIPGNIRLDLPDDSKTPVQIACLRYPASGELIDQPFNLPWAQSKAANIRFYWNAWFPLLDTGGTAIEGFIFDATTGEELTQVGGGAGFKEYFVNNRQPHYYASFTMTASGNQNLSPFLWNFKVVRDAVFVTTALSEIRIPEDYPLAKVTRVSVSGAERDITHDTCSLTIEDTGANLNYPLSLRAGERSQIWTEYDPIDATKRSILFDGYIDRPDATRKGSGTQAYPSPQWNSYDIAATGMFTRLKETLTSQIYLLNGASSDTQPGQFFFEKVTDFCKALIATAGFDSTKIDVPDSPIPFAGQNGNPGYLDSLTPVLDAVTKFLQDYLGWYFAWCPNSGIMGMWRAIRPTPLFMLDTISPLATFTMDGTGAGKLAFRPESYGSPNWVTKADGTRPTAPIRKKTLHYFPVKPEGNSVLVTGTSSLTASTDGTFRVQAEMRNLASYDSIFNDDGSEVVGSADPTSRDFLDRHIPIYVVIFGLQQAAVDAVCRRVYDVACHGYEVFSFQAPLVLVTDTTDTHQANPRPLRYQDLVTMVIDGVEDNFIVRNCNPIYTRDRVQMAQYEVQTYPPV